MGLVETMAAVVESIAARQVVRLAYVDRRGTSTERDVEPVALVAGPGDWYFVGWCRLRTAPRLFLISRIERARLLDEAAPPRDLANADPRISELVGGALGEEPRRGI